MSHLLRVQTIRNKNDVWCTVMIWSVHIVYKPSFSKVLRDFQIGDKKVLNVGCSSPNHSPATIIFSVRFL